MAEHSLPKAGARVRFPLLAHRQNALRSPPRFLLVTWLATPRFFLFSPKLGLYANCIVFTLKVHTICQLELRAWASTTRDKEKTTEIRMNRGGRFFGFLESSRVFLAGMRPRILFQEWLPVSNQGLQWL